MGMKRLINNNLKLQFLYLNDINNILNDKINELNSIKLSSIENEEELKFLKLANKILINKLIKLAEFNYKLYREYKLCGLHDLAEKIKNYQDDEINYKIKKSDIDYNLISKYVPESLQSGKGYRGIGIEPDKIDINNIESSLREIIWTGTFDSWSFNGDYVNNIENYHLSMYFTNKIPVRITTNVSGLHLPTFWKEILNKYYGEDREKFNSEYDKVDIEYKYEDEILADSPSNYNIYNLKEIEAKLIDKDYCK